MFRPRFYTTSLLSRSLFHLHSSPTDHVSSINRQRAIIWTQYYAADLNGKKNLDRIRVGYDIVSLVTAIRCQVFNFLQNEPKTLNLYNASPSSPTESTIPPRIFTEKEVLLLIFCRSPFEQDAGWAQQQHINNLLLTQHFQQEFLFQYNKTQASAWESIVGTGCVLWLLSQLI
jgi:hypothetical protein